MKHTPAPWYRNIKPARKYCTIFAGQNTHVTYLATQGFSDEEIEANCNLIVAAPELLGMVKKLDTILRGCGPLYAGGKVSDEVTQLVNKAESKK